MHTPEKIIKIVSKTKHPQNFIPIKIQIKKLHQGAKILEV